MATAADDAASAPSILECRALIDRVAGSSQFVRSPRLRAFLQYVGYGALEADAPEIHEHEIGVHVFDRSPNYDRSQDNIVRVNATELRKRIDKYFETEGVEERLIFSVPRGGYVPHFRWRETASENLVATSLKLAPTEKVIPGASPVLTRGDTRQRTTSWTSSVIAILLFVACCALWRENRILKQATDVWAKKPSVAEFWTSFTKAAPETDIVLPDASVTMSEEILGNSMSLSDYINRNFPGNAHGEELSADRRQDLDTIFNHSLVTLGDFKAAQQILALTPIASSLHLSPARFFEADSIKNSNVILIGGRKANPWAGLFDEQLNFSLEYEGRHRSTYIENRHPLPGEPTQYLPATDHNHIAGYSIIDYLPNLGRTGKVILLAGTDSDATAAAAEFMTSEDGLSSLKSRLHMAHIGYFEAILKVSRLDGTSFNAELLSVRAH